MPRLSFLAPMKASVTEPPAPSDPRWLYEMKFDGYRGIAVKNGRSVALFSRNRKRLDARFPGIVRAIAALPRTRCVLDGEICALDPRGRSSFQLIQNAEEGAAPLVYYVFDLLKEGAADLRDLPLAERKDRLATLLGEAGDLGPIRLSASFTRDARAVLARMKAVGAEGAVAKMKESRYETGHRSPNWVKIRFSLQQEFVVGGYTEPRGSRSGFGALLIGYRRGKELVYASKVGTGFTAKTLAETFRLLKARERKACPFAAYEARRHRWTRGPAAATHWVKPDLVAQIAFTEWTGDGSVRHPVFLGLRRDKPASQVVREPVAAPPSPRRKGRTR